MKDILLKARRAVRFLFYRNVSIEDQILVSDTLDDTELEILFWKLNSLRSIVFNHGLWILK